MSDQDHETDSVDDWIEYQQNEIDGAKEEIQTRMEHLASSVKCGMLEDGELLREHQNDRLQAYLEGYADALSYAAGRVERIDNLVKYAERHITEDSDD